MKNHKIKKNITIIQYIFLYFILIESEYCYLGGVIRGI